MFDWLVDLKNRIFSSRTNIIVALFVLFAVILLIRLFVLQIIMGSSYQDNYNLKVEKTQSIDGTRGNIYDRNGNLLAYNELSYAVTIQDIGEYETSKQKNSILNATAEKLVTNIEKNGDSVINDFGIALDNNGNYQFVNPEGTRLQRFRADVFGYSDPSDLTFNKKMNFDEATATPDEIMDYLCNYRYDISSDYPKEMQYKIALVRYNMGLNSYQKYISTTIASDVNEKTVAYVEENKNELPGVAIEEKAIRKYDEAEAFSSIVGYTGKVSTDELEQRKEEFGDAELNDSTGKVGIEKVMNTYLTGTKGSETIYVDSLGNPISSTKTKEPESGKDVYLSIDKNLQISAYKLLEQEIAGILVSKIANIKDFPTDENTNGSEILIPIYDVYYALIANNLVDRTKLNNSDASDCERSIYNSYLAKNEEVQSSLRDIFLDNNAPAFKDLPEEYQNYITFIINFMKSQNILKTDKIDKDDKTYLKWAAGEISVNEYLKYAIEENWIDISVLSSSTKYSDTDELYNSLIDYILQAVYKDNDFTKSIYKYAILDDYIAPNDLCAALYDQGFLPEDMATRNALANGRASSYDFLLSKIRTLEITPGQLGLDLCSGSSIVMNSKTGEILACVSYPGYDSNKLANPKDSSYYSFISLNNSRPMYNYATQQKTAPGSTFKIVSSTAGLAEGVIDTGTRITDLGIYDKVSNKPKCWIYPGSHGSIAVAEAIRDSCNYFFYEVGYRLAGSENYNDANGIKRLSKYASLYGLDQKTGVEVEESTSTLATEFPVMAAIGQSNHNITTIALARYVTAIASSGNIYDLTLLDHVADSNGNVIESYRPDLKDQVGVLDASQWGAIHSGMRMMAESYEGFAGFPIPVAGKTGTAQQSYDKPNHALFIGYAPYDNPDITIATRIAFGYTSHNAADVSKAIIGCYYNMPEYLQMINGEASVASATTTRTD